MARISHFAARRKSSERAAKVRRPLLGFSRWESVRQKRDSRPRSPLERSLRSLLTRSGQSWYPDNQSGGPAGDGFPAALIRVAGVERNDYWLDGNAAQVSSLPYSTQTTRVLTKLIG